MAFHPADLAALLQRQITDLRNAPTPQFGDTAGAFQERRRTARTSQADVTRQSQAEQAERAAAQGKTFSSAQTAAQSRIGQEGQNQLASILGALGIQEQGVLGQQAQQTATFEQDRRGQINQLLSLFSGLQGPGAGGAPQGASDAQAARDAAAARATSASEASRQRAIGIQQQRAGAQGAGVSTGGGRAGPAVRIPGQGLFDPVSSTVRAQQAPISSAGFGSFQGSTPTAFDLLGRAQDPFDLERINQLFGLQGNALSSFLG